MKKPTHIGLSLTAAALLVSVLGLGNSAVAQAGGVVLKPMRMTTIVMKKHLSCKVWGTPVEFPDSVLLTNNGAAVIAAGTRVHYYVTRGGRPTGNYTFTKALRRGASAYAPLPGGSARGAACTVRFMAAPTRLQFHRPQIVPGTRKTAIRRLPPRQALKPMRTVMPQTIQRMRLNQRITLRKHLSCKVWGTPVEFPDFVLLTNDGAAVIAAGTRVHYYVTRGGRPTGNYTFTKALRRGASTYAPLPGGSARGARCTVRFVAAPTHPQVRMSQLVKGVVISHHIVAFPPVISGKVKLAKYSDVPSSCARIMVSASERGPIPPGAALRMHSFKLVRTARASGDIKKNGYCEYRLTGLPLNKNLYVGVAANSSGFSGTPVGWTNPIKLTRRNSVVMNADLDYYISPPPS